MRTWRRWAFGTLWCQRCGGWGGGGTGYIECLLRTLCWKGCVLADKDEVELEFVAATANDVDGGGGHKWGIEALTSVFVSCWTWLACGRNKRKKEHLTNILLYLYPNFYS